MSRYFVILGAMRTGSNLLERTLGQLGDTVIYGEAFNPSFVGGPRKQDLLGWSRAQRDRDPHGFLDTLIGSGEGHIPGFRLFDGHSDTILQRILADPDCARVVLTREPLDSFVSLKIARTTDQWMLQKAKRRQTARIMFDAREFAAYRSRLIAHYDHVARAMAAAGTDAARIDYADLRDRAQLTRIARHIGSQGDVPAEPPILRQNPSALWEKVINHADMCSELGLAMDLPAAAQARDILCPAHLNLALAPIPGPALPPAAALIQRIEAQVQGQANQPRNTILKSLAHGRLFPAGPPGERPLFAMVCHPALRLHGLFLQALFGPGWRYDPVRQMVSDALGDLPDPKCLADGFQAHRAAFEMFLDIVADTLTANAVLTYRTDWLSQADILSAYRADGAVPEVISDLADFEAFADTLCGHAGIPAMPPGQVASLRTIGDLAAPALSSIWDDGLATRIRALHDADFDAFGFEPDLPG